MDQNQQNNWKGKLNELNIWNKELSVSDIQAWMNKNIDATHPFYSNLVAYYKLNEGSGQVITDSKNSLSVTGTNLQWTYDRGNKLNRMFYETAIRPNIIFVKGNYNVTTSTVTVKDSVARNPNIVMQYSVTSNATVVPVTDDVVNLVSTSNFYWAGPSVIYNGDTGVQTGTQAVTAQNTITVTTLNYFRRFPFYNEIMSFVTPYGIGLDLGPKGKTWYFDVTDFSPVLKGPRRLLMTLGGENQEQMDLDFWFIVGTPPRNVLEFNQIWQGAARAGGAAIGTINNDTRFTVTNVPLLANGQAFKLRSTITGHGAQGEFKSNGGTINHFFNVNGGTTEYTWQITNECADNPVYPQGGTWVYDREGWCPGRFSVLNEFKLTPFVTAGTSVSMDYGCSAPPVSSGDYRYIVANQLITYGAANNSLDARVLDVLAPSDKVLYSRANPICSRPVIVIQNTGSTPLTSVNIDYWVNNASVKENYTWTGNLAFMDTAIVALPINAVWSGAVPNSTNLFNVELVKANNATDQYSYNNTYRSTFQVPVAITNSFTIEFKTNSTLDNSYTLYDDQGNIAGTSNFVAVNTVYKDYYELNGCYTLKVDDSGHDGLTWWANTGQGSGYIMLKNANGNTIKNFETDFGKGFEFSFSTFNPSAVGQNDLGAHLNLFPNPSRGRFVLEGSELENADIKISDLLGHTIDLPSSKGRGTIEYNTVHLAPGLYLVTISKGNQSVVKKIVVN